MTIEAKIDALIEALNANTAAILGITDTKPASSKPEAVKPTKAKTPEQLIAETAAKPLVGTAAPEPQTPAKALTYDDVKTPFLALVKKNRDLALATLKPFGLDSLKPAKPEQFAAILAALNNALESA